MPLAGVVEHIYPGAAQTRIQTIVARSAVVRPAVWCREAAHGCAQVGVPHEDPVDVLPVYDFERPEEAPGKLVVDREVSRPDLRPLELWVHRVDVERLRQGGRVRARTGGPQGLRVRVRVIQVRILTRGRDHIADQSA